MKAWEEFWLWVPDPVEWHHATTGFRLCSSRMPPSGLRQEIVQTPRKFVRCLD